MTPDSTDPDDRLCEFLADRVVEIVAESFPGTAHGPDAIFRRRAARLLLSQITGRERPPGFIPMARVARRLGLTQQQASAMEARALLRARAAWFRLSQTPTTTDHET